PIVGVHPEREWQTARLLFALVARDHDGELERRQCLRRGSGWLVLRSDWSNRSQRHERRHGCRLSNPGLQIHRALPELTSRLRITGASGRSPPSPRAFTTTGAIAIGAVTTSLTIGPLPGTGNELGASVSFAPAGSVRAQRRCNTARWSVITSRTGSEGAAARRCAGLATETEAGCA